MLHMSLSEELIIPENLDWEILKRFFITAQSSSFKEAALKIGTSKGALNTQMSHLEEILNTEIFLRYSKNRSTKLTVNGQKLAAKVEAIKKIINEENIFLKNIFHETYKLKFHMDLTPT